MNHVRMLGIGMCVAAMLVLGVTVGASAALPEWGRCTATEGGSGGLYSDSACVVRAPKHKGIHEGGYEWKPATSLVTQTGRRRHIEVNGEFTFETESGARIECSSVSEFNAFVFLRNGANTPELSFEGCIAANGETCSTLSIGSVFGEISNALSYGEKEGRGWNHPAKLGFIEGRGSESPVVGLSFTGDNSGWEPKEGEEGEAVAPGIPERLFAPIECTSEEPGPEPIGTVWIGGEKRGHDTVIGTLAPVNQMTNAYTLTYGEGGAGMQMPEGFNGHTGRYLQAFLHNHWERVAWVGQLNLPVSEEWEIKATR